MPQDLPPGESPATDLPPIDRTAPQLTLRAMLTGMLLGAALSACTIYTGLTIGWGLNMSVTAILLSFAFWRAMSATLRTRPWGVLENNLCQTACSAGASIGSAGLVTAIPAWTLMTGNALTWGQLAVCLLTVSLVGVVVAIPMRRQLIIVDKLAFPSGAANGVLLREMYADGREATLRIAAMLTAAALAGAFAILTRWTMLQALLFGWVGKLWSGAERFRIGQVGLSFIPSSWLHGYSAPALTFSLDPSPLLVAVGGLIGFRGCCSLLGGAILAWLVIAPPLLHHDVIRLTANEPLAALPAEVDAALSGQQHERLRFRAGQLTFAGQMTLADRDRYLALSESSDYQAAMRRLYVRTQRNTAAAPGGTDYATRQNLSLSEPCIIPRELRVPPELLGLLRLEYANQRIVLTGRLTPYQRDVMRTAMMVSTAQQPQIRASMMDVTDAFDRLHARSYDPLFDGGLIPPQLAERVSFDPSSLTLVARGPVSPNDARLLLATVPADHASGSDIQAAVTALVRGATLQPPAANFRDINAWLVWPGVTLMVVSSLVAFSFSTPAILRAFRFSRGPATGDHGEMPMGWLLGLIAGVSVAATAAQVWLFAIHPLIALLSVALAFVLALVSGRVSGETNITPVGAMGKVTQLSFGVLAPRDAATNLMTANVTGGAASQCADLLHDLKTGSLLGAAPWKQSVAQIGGVVAGALAGPAFYFVILRNPQEQLFSSLPAPAVASWRAVAELFQVGLGALPPYAGVAMAVAAALGVLLPVLERVLPRRAALFVPSASAVGLAFVIFGFQSVSMFLGGTIALLAGSVAPKWAARFVLPLCAGVIAGESLLSVGFAMQIAASEFMK